MEDKAHKLCWAPRMAKLHRHTQRHRSR